MAVFLIIMGFGSLLLPMMGVQFRLMSLLDAYQPSAGVGIGILGLVLAVVAGGGEEEA